MSTDTPPLPDDETREHAEEPAEGAESVDPSPEVREHASEPAEGEDTGA
ncbi:hypothetical protein [Cellulomonas sp. ICMP 17802]